MCLINFAYHYHHNYRLIVAANRDEFYERPTEKAHYWGDFPHILAGRDMEGLGTWMGVTKNGRFAALTNFRETNTIANARTRGELVSQFLIGDESPYDYLTRIQSQGHLYNGFNLLVADQSKLFYYSNRETKITELAAGLYGLSNAYLDTSWPKVTKGKQLLRSCIDSEIDENEECLLHTLTDNTKAIDEELPETGVGIVLERQLSPIFIKSPNYGTRSSTVLMIDNHNRITYTERTFDRNDTSTVRYSFKY
ncbi:NRDE family protein [Anaerobacillus sp. MEB173]|uniref:NRDE family protein n=1 Tax=Anaerobacillus sp. MEB173 TaxID=3383345 RepID=UPI003F8F1FB1